MCYHGQHQRFSQVAGFLTNVCAGVLSCDVTISDIKYPEIKVLLNSFLLTSNRQFYIQILFILYFA